jgi:hypothetical protein
MDKQRSLRSSQAIQPYGPGAMLDWGQECFVVLGTDKSNPGWLKGAPIELPRLQSVLGSHQGFRLPPKTVGRSRPNPPLAVLRFPAWLFCPRCRFMHEWRDDRENNPEGQVPVCKRRSCVKPKSILVPMRWVAACPDGHLEDINWWRWTHSSRNSADGPCDWKTSQLKFTSNSSRGASMEALGISCSQCGAKKSLKDLMRKGSLVSIGQSCRGKQPWQSVDDAEECEADLLVLQRSQAGLHLGQVVSALDIRTDVNNSSERVHALESHVRDSCDTPAEVLGMSKMLAKQLTKKFRRSHPDASPFSAPEVEAFAHLLDPNFAPPVPEPSVDQESALVSEEWTALTTEVEHPPADAPLLVRAAPILPGGRYSALHELFTGVFLVDRLREVRAFKGFTRIGEEGRFLYPNLTRRPPSWLPATEVFGEGIFLQFNNDCIAKWEQEQAIAFQERNAPIISAMSEEDHFGMRFKEREDYLLRFLMVHTFSHLMIRQLCFESGYHNASLRERLYVFGDRAGVLLYTAEGDSEGSLGGLVRQGEPQRLWPTMMSALERSAWCSNDPVCKELPGHGPGRSNLAACHACTMAAETSCTEGNSMLDRVTVIGEANTNTPGAPTGFFRPALNSVLRELAITDETTKGFTTQL